MSKVLIRFKGNWADEMDLFGFEVMEEEVWEAHLKRIRQFLEDGGPYERSVGTNEYIDYPNYEAYNRHFTVIKLTDAEMEVIEKCFPPYNRGQFAAIRREEMWEYPLPEDEGLEF